MHDDERTRPSKDDLTRQLFRAARLDGVAMNRTERYIVGVLLVITGVLVSCLAVGFVVFVCAVLLIEGGVGRFVGIAGLVGLAVALLLGLRHWIRRTS
jgi:hypothetical protein